MTPSTQQPSSIPMSALALGAAGLVPFVVLGIEIVAAQKLLFGPGPALYALQIYGAVILSFLGGVAWGAAMTHGHVSALAARLAASVVPPLTAWAGVWFPGRYGLLILAGGLAAVGAFDVWSAARGEMPRWYGQLRLWLTAAAVTVVLATGLFGPF